MPEPVASYLNRAGRGASHHPWSPWPESTQEAFEGDSLERWRWSECFDAPCKRFGRMDGLSRLALAAVELLGLDTLGDATRADTAVILATDSGCVAADLAFLESGGPALFAYTLPSTPIGEICIRHRLQGPVLCLCGKSDPWLAAEQVLAEGQAAACVLVAAEYQRLAHAGPGACQAAAAWLPSETHLPAMPPPFTHWCREQAGA